MRSSPAALIIWSDEALLVVNKPAGLPALPDGYNPQAAHLKSLLEPAYGKLWVVHRLDRETSGVMALARSAAAHRALNTQFQERQTGKRYHALLSGAPEWDAQTANAPLLPNGDRRHRTIVDQRQGKPARTAFRILERFEGYALVEAAPETGRTHQIRAHLAYLGYPILADVLYGGAKVNQPHILSRTALHAWSLELAHPLTGEPLRFTAPYADDFQVALERLRVLR
jgi:RluA family pseudouridine synthase